MAASEDPKSDERSSFFYHATLKSVPNPIADILQNYSGIPREEQISHIVAVRDRAYKAHAYPCLGRFRFLELELSAHPLYQSYIVPRLQNGAQEPEGKLMFLDVGCCLGQDIRKLIYDGVDKKYLYGGDIVEDFIDAGYELFRDEQKLPRDHFICPADLFDNSEGNKLGTLDGQVDLLHISAVFHLFDEGQQYDVAVRCMRLLNKTPGSKCLIFGAQVGNKNASAVQRQDGSGRFRHNDTSWGALWESVCEREEFRSIVKKLTVEVHLKKSASDDPNGEMSSQHMAGIEEGFRWLVFSVWLEF